MPVSDDSQSIRREIPLRRDKVGASAIALRRKREELLIVAPGLHSISGASGGLCAAREGAIAVRIVAQRSFEFLQCLRRLIRFEQQLAEQFPDRGETVFHRDMLTASIFQLGGLTHRRNGIPFAAPANER